MAADNVPKTLTNSIGMKLTFIPAGKFMMGTDESKQSLQLICPDQVVSTVGEGPEHEVRITRPFYLGTYTVTRGQFKEFVAATKYRTDAEKNGGGWGYTGIIDKVYHQPFGQRPEFSWHDPGFDQTDDHPVVMMSWNDAEAFCAWLSKKEHKIYRLPTEAEWEYACRAGTTTRYFFGDKPKELAKYANLIDATTVTKFPRLRRFQIHASDGYVFTAPVGSFLPNSFGLYDMHGNVLQWCSDWYDPNYYENSPTDDPQGPTEGAFQRVNWISDDPIRAIDGGVYGRQRVVRGGGWYSSPLYCRSAARLGDWPMDDRIGFCVGFRIAVSLTDSEAKSLGFPLTKPLALQNGDHPRAGELGAGQPAGPKANDNAGLAAAHQWLKSDVESQPQASQFQQAVDKAVAERQAIRMVFDSNWMKSGQPEMFYLIHGEFFPFKLTKQQFDDADGKAAKVTRQTWRHLGPAADSPVTKLSDLSIDRVSGDKDTGLTISLSVHCKQMRHTARAARFIMDIATSRGMKSMSFKANKDLPQDGRAHLEFTLKLAKGRPAPAPGRHHFTPQQEAAFQMLAKDESMSRTQPIFVGFYTEWFDESGGIGSKLNSNTVATLLETADK